MQSFKRLCLFLFLCAALQTVPAVALECQTGSELGHTFDSGASWSFCAVLDDDHALEIQELHYRAPGDSSRKVLQHLHLAQILLHHHDEPAARSLIGSNRLGEDSLKTLNAGICDGELHSLAQQPAKLCSFVRPTGLMAKYNMRPGLQGEQYQLFSVSEYEGFTFKIMIGLSEDGRINPAVTLSGRSTKQTGNAKFGNAVVNPLDNQTVIATQSSVLYTWRMVFSLNGDQRNDTVEELEFNLEQSLSSRRPMQITTLATETLRKVDADSFRGWRIVDVDGRGYYLDPQNSGFAYSDNNNNWAQFDFALTAFNPCERHSTIASSMSNTDETDCAGSLDNFVNGESMAETKPVLWYSLSRVHRPSAEDYPIISSMISDFEIIPFDWTPTSPFEVIGE